MAKKVVAVVKLQIPAGKANPSPPVGPALSQHGVNIAEFCKTFNSKTGGRGDDGVLTRVNVSIYGDRSFSFDLHGTPASFLLRQAAGLAKASQAPGTEIAGSVTREQVRSIAEKKLDQLSAHNIEGAMKIIEGTARSMGLEVVDD